MLSIGSSVKARFSKRRGALREPQKPTKLRQSRPRLRSGCGNSEGQVVENGSARGSGGEKRHEIERKHFQIPRGEPSITIARPMPQQMNEKLLDTIRGFGLLAGRRGFHSLRPYIRPSVQLSRSLLSVLYWTVAVKLVGGCGSRFPLNAHPRPGTNVPARAAAESLFRQVQSHTPMSSPSVPMR
jgi:hypothetical protein